MRKPALITSAATMALVMTGAIGWYLATPSYATKKTIGDVTARQISATEWTLNCLACADVAMEVCSNFSVVSKKSTLAVPGIRRSNAPLTKDDYQKD